MVGGLGQHGLSLCSCWQAIFVKGVVTTSVKGAVTRGANGQGKVVWIEEA